MKKILITGGSHAEVPLIKEARRENYYVITTGNNTAGMGHALADKYVPGDFSDKEFVYRLARKEGVEAIVSGCNDFAYLSTAYACEKLGLKGHDTEQVSSIIHHKNQFRKLCASLGIRAPEISECKTLEDVDHACACMKFPVIVKPVDLTGGKGIRRCDTEGEVLGAYNIASDISRQPVILIEEYIFGKNHGGMFFIKDGRVRFTFLDDEHYYLSPYLVAGTCAPSSVPQYVLFQLIRDVERIAASLKLVDGLFHTQFIVEENGSAVIIDPCRRCPGDLYVKFVEYTIGCNITKYIFDAEQGKNVSFQEMNAHNFIIRHCIMTNKIGVYEGLDICPSIRKYIIDSVIWAVPGETIDDCVKYKAGILFLKFDTFDEIQKILPVFDELVKIKVK